MKITVTFLFFTCCLYSKAQNNYNFFHLFLDRGLSDARVNAIVQDKYGFMWFATSNGLNRFDGYSIKTFYANKRENGLTSNSILSLLSDSKGNLWAGTSNGVVKYNFSTEIFERFVNGEGIDTASVSCFEEDTQGNIYAGTREGLYCFHPDTKQWENLSVFYKLKDRFTSIRGLLMFNENTLFATTENRGFYKINLAKKTLDSIYYKTEVSDTCCIFLIGMEKLNKDELLVGMLSFGMNKFNVTTNQFSTIKGPLYKSDSIKYNSVSQIIKDHQGRFWAASTYYRVAEYLPDQNITVAIDKDSNNPYAFDGNTALCIYEDRQNNIWVGTSARGLYRFNPNQKRTQFYSENDYIKGALQQGQVTAISVLDSNTVLISSDRGPSFYHKKTNSFTNYKGGAKDFDTLPVEMASSGIEDQHGIVWIGSNRLGLMRYDTLKKTFKVFSRMSSPVPLRDDGVSDILEMNGDSLMLLGFNRIVTFDTKKFLPVCYRNNNAPLYQLKRIADFCYDNDRKNIWLASATGSIYEYDPNRKILTDKTDLLNTTVKPSVIYKLAFDSYGNIWCATDIGAILLQKNKPAKIFSLATRKNISKEVRNVLPLGKDIWIANSRSVAKLKPGNGKLIFVGEKDGLTEVQLFGGSLTATAWNTVLIGSNRGFYEIYPDKVTEDNNDAAEPYLTNFRVFDKPFITTDVISTVKEIRLTYKENFFSFDLSAFDYAEANDIEYAYKLEGFDKDWQYAGQSRSGSYTNVPGGDYTLKLKAKNTTGEWNEKGQSIHIIIASPFWETWWFILLFTTAAILIFYFAYKNRIRSIEKDSKLRSDFEIKLNELENSALRTQMNPHFIFNSLNTINSFINRNEPLRANQYISKFSKLMRLILDHSREKKILLADELIVLELYIQLERIRFDNKFDYTITINDSVDTEAVEIPPMIIQPFVENAILHGLLPLPAGGHLSVILQKENNTLLCIIEDNGIGRQQAQKNKPVVEEKRKSHGIEITLKRIKLFNKEHLVSKGVSITDLKNAAGKSTGTRVSIPLAWENAF